MAYLDDIDQRIVKRSKFGPLDVYPQEERQKEDELSYDYVKGGFKYVLPELLKESEFSSFYKDHSSTGSFDADVLKCLTAIVHKREETNINNQIEASKKIQATQRLNQTYKPNPIYITSNPKTKEQSNIWFRQLASNEPLAKLSKKIPMFNKRHENLPEIIVTLYEFQVPITRAVWYLKIMVYSFQMNISNEPQAKKRRQQQNIDVASEWTLPLVKFLREIFVRLQLFDSQTSTTNLNHLTAQMQQQYSFESFMNTDNLSVMLININSQYLTEHKLKCLWTYTTKLMRGMMDQNLLDKQIILETLLEMLEKSMTPPTPTQSTQLPRHPSMSLANSSSQQPCVLVEYYTTKMLLNTIIHNMHFYLQSEILSRRMAYFCCKRLANMFNEYSSLFFDSAIKDVCQQEQQQPTNTNALLAPLQVSSLLLTQQKSPETGASSTNMTGSNSLQLATNAQSTSTTPPTKLKPFVTSTNLTSQLNKPPSSSQSSSKPLLSTNETINYTIKNYVPLKSVRELFEKFLECPIHREQIVLLTSIVHSIQLGCMQALIWNDVGDGKESPYNGSPLDLLPCPPSRLVFTYDYNGITGFHKNYIRTQLEKTELCIKRRSMAIENNWCVEILKQTPIGIMQTKILKLLDILDKVCFDLSDVNETIESLYSQIFPPIDLIKTKQRSAQSTAEVKTEPSAATTPTGSAANFANPPSSGDESPKAKKQTSYIYSRSLLSDDEFEVNRPLSDKEIINLLCDWATTTKRYGLHRIFYAVFLIKKRQLDWAFHLREADQHINDKIRPKKKRSPKKSDDELAQSGSTDSMGSRKRKLKSESDPFDDEANTSKEAKSINASKKIRLEEDLVVEEIKSVQGKSVSPTKRSIDFKIGKLESSDSESDSDESSSSDDSSESSESDDSASSGDDENESDGEANQAYDYLFQKVLFDYLENRAPYLDESSTESRLKFANIISLFHMFINCKLFSHDRFVCSLISRGETFRNNLSDVKKPANLYNLVQSKTARDSSKMRQMNSVNPSYSSPMSVYQQQPASMPAYTLPPHTPLQSQKSFTNLAATSATATATGGQMHPGSDSFYNVAPMSVPTPSKLPSASLISHQQQQQQHQQHENDHDNKPLGPPPPLTSSRSFMNMSASTNRQLAPPPRLVAQQQRTLTKQQSTSAANIQPKQARPIKSQSSVSLNSKPMTKLAQYVLHIPIPQTQQFTHENNQRFVVLYGFGSKKQEILEKINAMTRSLLRLFVRKSSFDLTDVQPVTSSKLRTPNLGPKLCNRITTLHYLTDQSEQEAFNSIYEQYKKLSHYDQYTIISKVQTHILDVYKCLNQKNYLPKLQYIQFVFDLMEFNVNLFNLILFSIRLMRMGPSIEAYLKKKLVPNSNSSSSNGSNRTPYFEYVSYFYLNLIGIFRFHLVSLCLWKDLAVQVFKFMLRLVRNVEKPTRCSSHEKSAFLLMNEMFTGCSYIREQFQSQFEPFAAKIKAEKVFTALPSFDKKLFENVSFQMRQDEQMINFINTNEHTIDEIDAYVSSKTYNYYNFVAHTYVSIASMNKHELVRVANLCAEITCRNHMLIYFWINSLKSLFIRNTDSAKEKMLYLDLLNKVSIQSPRAQENFKLFFSILASRNCFVLNEFIISIVKSMVMASPAIVADQSHNHAAMEPSASLACHVLQYLFTSVPKPLVYRSTSFDRRLIAASFRTLCFNTFLLVLKGLFLISDTKKEQSNASANTTSAASSSKESSSSSRNRNGNNGGNSSKGSKQSTASDDSDKMELDQFASNALQEICEHAWIKERCFNEGDNLIRPNQLLEPALGRRAQNLLHIIYYPQTHQLRKVQNEQMSTKDIIKNILVNLDIWTFRESLMEFKLMIELQNNKDNHYEYFIECLAKTTVDFLIDPEKPTQTTQPTPLISHFKSSKMTQQMSTSNDDENQSQDSSEESGADGGGKSPSNPSSMTENQQQASYTSPLNGPDTNVNNDDNSTQMDVANESSQINEDTTNNEETTNNAGASNDAEMGETKDEELDQQQQQLQYQIERELEEQEEQEREYLEQHELEMQRHYHMNRQSIGVWLIAPLISKLQGNCQLKVIETTSTTLQNIGKQFWSAKTKSEKEIQAVKNLTAWTQQPFYALLNFCIKNNDRRPILNSLFNGIQDFITYKEDKILSEDPRIKQIMVETLSIRLSLVGSMFDFILSNQNDFINWAWLFVQLIYTGVIDPDSDQLCFTMTIDMLAVLIHHIISLEQNLDTNRFYQSIIKKISKETKDFGDVPNTKAINYIRRLMPLSKQSTIDVITVDSLASTTSKGQAAFDKRKGFKFVRKEKVTTWEMIEGVKNISSLCSSWFGSLKIERKVLRYEYQQRLLVRHKHMNIFREASYFKERPAIDDSDLVEVVEPSPPPPPPSNPTLQSQQSTSGSTKKDAKQALASTLNEQQRLANEKLNQMNSNADVQIIGSTMPPSTFNQINGARAQASTSAERKQTNRSLSTPDKQKGAGGTGGGSTTKKQRGGNSTTPRSRNRGIAPNDNTAGNIIPPPTMLQNQPNQVQQQQAVRSTNSPMPPNSQQPQQFAPGQQMLPNPQINNQQQLIRPNQPPQPNKMMPRAGQMMPNPMAPNVPNQQQQQRMPAPMQGQPPPPNNFNPAMNMNMPNQSQTPPLQPVQSQMPPFGQQAPRGNMQLQQPGNRMSYAGNANVAPNLQAQLSQPQAEQMHMQQQRTMAPNQAGQQRMMPGQQATQAPFNPMAKQQSMPNMPPQRTTTPDPMMGQKPPMPQAQQPQQQQQAYGNAQQNPAFMGQQPPRMPLQPGQQPQQQQAPVRMQTPTGNMQNWQQQAPQQAQQMRPNMAPQQRPQLTPQQQQQYQQQQQFNMQKQQPQQIMNPNGSQMMQQPQQMMNQQQQQQQQKMAQQQPPQQYY